MSQRIVINSCFGGFGLSHKATLRLGELMGKVVTWELDDICVRIHKEHHPDTTLTPEDATAIVHYHDQDGNYFWPRDIERDSPLLLQVLEELGEAANSRFSQLEVVEIPDGVEWEIAEYDGNEHIAEKHRTWPA